MSAEGGEMLRSALQVPGLMLDGVIAREVLGLEVLYGEFIPFPEREHDPWRPIPRYSTDIAAAWTIVEKMVSQLGYDHIGREWLGPNFKPEHHYLTEEGYPLGTTCWYVRVCWAGLIRTVCAETAPLAICRAALIALEDEAEEIKRKSKQPATLATDR